jgi:hypothetical protein
LLRLLTTAIGPSRRFDAAQQFGRFLSEADMNKFMSTRPHQRDLRPRAVPSATDILWDLKRQYYCCEENQEITRQSHPGFR